MTLPDSAFPASLGTMSPFNKKTPQNMLNSISLNCCFQGYDTKVQQCKVAFRAGEQPPLESHRTPIASSQSESVTEMDCVAYFSKL